jgi:hypothetical protein
VQRLLKAFEGDELPTATAGLLGDRQDSNTLLPNCSALNPPSTCLAPSPALGASMPGASISALMMDLVHDEELRKSLQNPQLLEVGCYYYIRERPFLWLPIKAQPAWRAC